MRKLLVLTLALLLAGSAFAIIEPDDNVLGLYFDLNADEVCALGVSPYDSVELYLIYTNPTYSELYGFEAGLTMEGSAILLTNVFANPQALNVGDNMNMIVGFGVPTVTTPATLLSTMEILYTDVAGGPVSFFLHGTEPSSIDPAYPVLLLVDGQLMQVFTPSPFGPVAQINECIVVATQPMTFEQVKSLYR